MPAAVHVASGIGVLWSEDKLRDDVLERVTALREQKPLAFDPEMGLW